MSKATASIRCHGITFPVFRAADGRHGIRYKIGSRWKTCFRGDLPALQAAADTIAVALVNGDTCALDISPAERRIYIAARDALQGTGWSVDIAARDAAEAHRITGGAVSLRDLALHYRRTVADACGRTVADVAASVLAEHAERPLSGRFKRDIRNDLARITAAFGPRDISSVTPEDLLAWLRGLQTARGFGWKRRNHLRNAAVYLWSHAKRMGWLPADRDTAAQSVPALDPPRRTDPITTYTPAEMRAYIANIRPQYLPWLLLCGFATVRSEEVAPDPDSDKDGLRWEDIQLASRVIRVRRETSKVREPRLVPIPENLAAWLADYSGHTGLVCPGRQPSKSETARLSRISSATVDGRQIRIRWKTNALRHTVISARLAIVKSRAQVAEEAGTSEAKIRAHYHEPMPESQAAAWFDILPENRAQNVLELWKAS